MSRHHHIHILLSLTLFLLFVLGSFFVVAYEIKGYQKLNEQCLLEDDLIITLTNPLHSLLISLFKYKVEGNG